MLHLSCQREPFAVAPQHVKQTRCNMLGNPQVVVNVDLRADDFHMAIELSLVHNQGNVLQIRRFVFRPRLS